MNVSPRSRKLAIVAPILIIIVLISAFIVVAQHSHPQSVPLTKATIGATATTTATLSPIVTPTVDTASPTTTSANNNGATVPTATPRPVTHSNPPTATPQPTATTVPVLDLRAPTLSFAFDCNAPNGAGQPPFYGDLPYATFMLDNTRSNVAANWTLVASSHVWFSSFQQFSGSVPAGQTGKFVLNVTNQVCLGAPPTSTYHGTLMVPGNSTPSFDVSYIVTGY